MITPSTTSPYTLKYPEIYNEKRMLRCVGSFDTAVNYSTVESAGPAARPLEFPTPTVNRVSRRTCQALDHRNGRIHTINNVLIIQSSQQQEKAYLIRKKIAKSIYGNIRVGVVLKRRQPRDDNDDENKDIGWISTDRLVAIKLSSWAKMSQYCGRHLEDPIREISAMQLIGNYHPNLIGPIEVLQEDDYLYTVMPYCAGGDLFGRVMNDDNYVTNEGRTRIWFRQLLSGLSHLQKKGVCHRDISLENIMVDGNGNLVIIDLGMCLRVPYTDPSNMGCVTDVSEGSERRLMVVQGEGGNLLYMAPEVVEADEAFDGFAIDLWAAGVVLFILLTGMEPFRWAHDSDENFSRIAMKGELKEVLKGQQNNNNLSTEAINLLQNMLWRDPRKRLTLADIMQHPWLLGKKFATCASPKNTSPRSISKTAIFLNMIDERMRKTHKKSQNQLLE